MDFDIKGFLKDHKGVLLPILGLIVVILLMGFMSSDASNLTLSTSVNNITGLDSNTASPDENKNNKYSSAPAQTLKSGVDYSAEMTTNFGVITIDLLEKDTPKTVNNFVFLVEEGFYDGLGFHRIIPSFMIQGGDPLGTGTGSPGYRFNDEIDADAIGIDDILVKDSPFLWNLPTYTAATLESYADKSLKELYTDFEGYTYTPGFGSEKFGPYILAMANSGPDSNGSQFFITTGTTGSDHLNGKHTIFGKVTAGQDVVDSIESAGDGAAVVINSVKIVQK